MGRSKHKNEGQYVNMPYALLKSPAWRSLSGNAIKLWFELHTRFNGGNNGRLILSYNEAKRNLGMGKATVQRAFAELQEKGFVVLVREGNWYHRRAHEWQLTTKPVHKTTGKQPATNDWRGYRSPKTKTKSGSNSDPSDASMVPP